MNSPRLTARIALILVCLPMVGCAQPQPVTFVEHETKIDVLIGNKLFTSYVHALNPDTPLLAKGRIVAKPVLFPVYSPSGTMMTRGYPFLKVDGEKQDHPHHMGVYFTIDIAKHGSEAGGNFWGNSQKPLPAIKHIEVTEKKPGRGQGTLSTTMHWVGSSARILLEEKRTMVFRALDKSNQYAIDMTSTLTAQDKQVVITDTKEGMLAVRVAPWLKEKDGTGRYLSSNGEQTEKNVWGKRAKWMRLQGQKDSQDYGIAILNHPDSTNYPTYWHARGYGCFSANPLGQGAFQKGRKAANPQNLNLTLNPGQSALFKHRLLFYEGEKSQDQLESEFKAYVSMQKGE
jgi:hypothetical protein